MLSGKAFHFKTAHNSLPTVDRQRTCVLLCYMYINFVPNRKKKKNVDLHKVILLKRIKNPHQLTSLSPIFERPFVNMLCIVIFNGYIFCNTFTHSDNTSNVIFFYYFSSPIFRKTRH